MCAFLHSVRLMSAVAGRKRLDTSISSAPRKRTRQATTDTTTRVSTRHQAPAPTNPPPRRRRPVQELVDPMILQVEEDSENSELDSGVDAGDRVLTRDDGGWWQCPFAKEREGAMQLCTELIDGEKPGRKSRQAVGPFVALLMVDCSSFTQNPYRRQ